jgi:hypothetical protein
MHNGIPKKKTSTCDAAKDDSQDLKGRKPPALPAECSLFF